MNYNKAIIVGNLTREVSKRELPSGQIVVDFSVATNRYWTDALGKKQEQVEFHNIVAFGKLAELCFKFLKARDQVMLDGRIQTRNWIDKEGQKHWKTEIVMETLQLPNKKVENEQDEFDTIGGI